MNPPAGRHGPLPVLNQNVGADLKSVPRFSRLPPWFRVQAYPGPQYRQMKKLVGDLTLHTVCEEARCPNLWDCWNRGTATFMILGDVCTRSCGFCAVATGRPVALDADEPRRVARAVQALSLRHAVITSVNRDERADGGAEIFAETVLEIRRLHPDCTVELLIPDFKGSHAAQDRVFAVRPDILNHNTETVPRLYRPVRPQGKYFWSLELISRAKRAGLVTKSGLMVGLGETTEEVWSVMADLVAAGCDILTLGQYLQPTQAHLPVVRYYPPDEFSAFREEGLRLGFRHVESGPLVRSSYHAEQQVPLVEGADFKSVPNP
jgi:lipoic acid synthetase